MSKIANPVLMCMFDYCPCTLAKNTLLVGFWTFCFSKDTPKALRGKAAVLKNGPCTHLALKYLYILSLPRGGTCTLVAN